MTGGRLETVAQLLGALATSPETPILQARPRPGAPYETVTAAQFCGGVEAAAAGLAASGVVPGTPVALVLPSGPTWHRLDFASARAGAVSVPCHHYLTAEELGWILDASGARVVVLDEGARWDAIAACRGGLPGVQRVLAADGDCSSSDSRVFDLTELETMSGSSPLPADVDPESLATILYTSGTTGQPKGVLLSHRNLMAAVSACRARQSLERGHVAASFLPLSHVLEKVVTLTYLACGVQIAYSTPATLSTDLLEIRPHYLVGVPRVFEKIRARALGSSALHNSSMRGQLVELITRKGRRLLGIGEGGTGRMGRFSETVADRLMGAQVRRRLGGRLLKVISGGAPLETDLVPFFAGLGIPIYEGYGLSETAAVVCISPEGGAIPGSVGTAVADTEIRVVEDEQWLGFRPASAPRGEPEVGEIQVRGPQVFSGYKDLPEATAAAFTADGWFRTGDLGTIDEGGYVRLHGRSKHILVTSRGKKVTPTPMEQAFAMSPLIERAVVIGEGRPFLILLVEPNLDNLSALARTSRLPEPTDAIDLATHAEFAGLRAILWNEINARQEHLSGPERVHAFRVLPHPLSIAEGTLTPTLKVRRHVVIERHADLIDSAYSKASQED